MTKAEAKEILDAARAGVEVSRKPITAALRVTGDLPPSKAESSGVVWVPQGAWHVAPRPRATWVGVVA
jgi:hypothetical protein